MKHQVKSSFQIHPDHVLFFDLDGTLIDTNLANFLAYKKAIQLVIGNDNDLTHDPERRFNRSTLKAALPHLNEDELLRIVRQKENLYEEYLPETNRCKEVADILFMYSNSNKTVLVTNCRENRAKETLRYHKLADSFSHFFFRLKDEKGLKHNKFKNAIRELDISPNIVIAFENEDTEIEDAKLAGIPHKNILRI